MKFEHLYDNRYVSHTQDERELINKFLKVKSEEGWELITVTVVTLSAQYNRYDFFFKRPVVNSEIPANSV